MRSTVIIEQTPDGYFATATGKNGEGYDQKFCGSIASEAAIWASSAMVRFALNNDEGGDLVAPSEVLDKVPEHLRKIDGKPQKLHF